MRDNFFFFRSLAFFHYTSQETLSISWLHLANVDLLVIAGRYQDRVCLYMFLGNSLTCFHYSNNDVIYLFHRGRAEIIEYSLQGIV